MENIFNSSIGNLAQDIASNIDIQSMISDVDINNEDPSKIFESIMNPETFSGLFKSINNIVQTKMENNELDTSDIEKDAQKMFPSFENNPILKSMMENDNIMNQMNNRNTANTTNTTNTNNPTKRLQKI